MTSERASGGSPTSTVVLVDDEAMVLRGFERVLAGRPYAVEAYLTAHEAIERVARGGVEVIVNSARTWECSS